MLIESILNNDGPTLTTTIADRMDGSTVSTDTTTNTTTNTNTKYPEITKLLGLVTLEFIASCGSKSHYECLKEVLKVNHYWPQLQIKRFFQNSQSLVLLHNTYKRQDTKHFQPLYDEARSVVLDLSNGTVVLTLSNAIPKQMSMEEYDVVRADDDICEQAFEGTTVSVFNFGDTWNFSTTSCPTIDSSRFNVVKTHGQMLNEALVNVLNVLEQADDKDKERAWADQEPPVPVPINVRTKFTDKLDKSMVYTFILVHHENTRLFDHSDQLGVNYATLVHIGTRSINDLDNVDVNLKDAGLNVTYPQLISNSADWFQENKDNTFGLIIKKKDGSLIKVQAESIISDDKHNMGHQNHWVNMLAVYTQSNPAYKVDNYIEQYCPEFKHNNVSPTYIIHTAICTMRDMLYALYRDTTFFNKTTKRYVLYKEVDETLPPLLRFHLAQLRYIQITTHSHAPINKVAVYRYLCDNSQKNFKIITRFFSHNPVNINAKGYNAIYYLDNALNSHTYNYRNTTDTGVSN